MITHTQIVWGKNKNAIKRSFKLWACKLIYTSAVVQVGKSLGGGLEMAMIKRCDFSDRLICNLPLCFRSSIKHIKYYRDQFILKSMFFSPHDRCGVK